MKLVQCGPGLRYSVNLRIQTYTEPVPLKYGKLATKYPWIYGYFYSVHVCLYCYSSKKVATVVVATARNAVVQSYSPVGARMYCHSNAFCCIVNLATRTYAAT